MNTQTFNVINVALLTTGGILIYCGVKNISPKQALQQIISGSKAQTPVASDGTGAGSKTDPFAPGGGNSGGGGGGGGSGSW